MTDPSDPSSSTNLPADPSPDQTSGSSVPPEPDGSPEPPVPTSADRGLGNSLPEQPVADTPVTPRQSSSRGLTIGLVVGLVLVAVALSCCIGGTAVFLFMKHSENSSSAPAVTAVRPDPAGSGLAASGKVRIVVPDQIGTLTKSASQQGLPSMMEKLESSGLEQPFMATYRDQKPGQIALIWGGRGTLSGEENGGLNKVLEQFSDKSSIGTMGPPTEVPTGALGGTMSCSTGEIFEIATAVCVWLGSDGLLGINLTGFERDQAIQYAQMILPAVVVKS